MTIPKQVLITGGAGFIGSHLADRLLSAGARVRVIDDLSTGSLDNIARAKLNPGFEFRQSRVSECGDLSRLVSESDLVIHLAAAVGVELVIKSPIQTITTNLEETRVILDACSAGRKPVILASTSEVYGKSAKSGFAEEDDLLIGPPHLGRWSYACSKLMDEFLALAFARERGVPVLIVRFFNTVGPRQTGAYGMVLPRFIAAARAGKPIRIFGSGQQTRCFCYVGDVVESLLRLQANPAAWGQVVNVGTDEEVTILELAQRVIGRLGSKAGVEFVPYSEAYAPGFEDMQRRKPLIDKLERLTSFRPGTSLDRIIELTAGI